MANEWVLESSEPVGEPSTLKRAGQFVGGLATRAAQAPFNIPSAIAKGTEYLGSALGGSLPQNPIKELNVKGPSQIIRDLPENIEKAGKYVFGDIEPENIASKALQYSAGNWPLLFAGGVPGAAKVGADIAGSLGTAAAEKISDNPLVGIGAHILGQKGFKKAANWWNKTVKDPSKITQYISKQYDKTNSLGSKIKVDTEPIKSDLNKINSKLAKEYKNVSNFDEASKNRVISNLATAEKALNVPGVTAADLAAEEKLLNKAFSWKNSTENDYYNEIRKAFSSNLESISKKNHEFGNAYNTSKELYKIDKWQSDLGRWVSDKSSRGDLGKIVSNPTAQAALSLLSGIGTGIFHGTPAGIATAIATKAVPAAGKLGVKASDATRKAGKFLFALGKSNDGRKLLMEIVADSAKENASALTKSIHKLNKKAEKWDLQNPEQDEMNGWTLER